MPLPPSSFGQAQHQPLPCQLDPMPVDESGLYMVDAPDVSDDNGPSQSPSPPTVVPALEPAPVTADSEEVTTTPNVFSLCCIDP
jgi:hypothetical protein